MKNRATWPGFFANAGLAGAFFAFAGLWAVPYLTQMHGMSRSEASSHVSIYFIGFAIGSMLWGNVSDRIGTAQAGNAGCVRCSMRWAGACGCPGNLACRPAG
jgi:MFS family permease